MKPLLISGRKNVRRKIEKVVRSSVATAVDERDKGRRRDYCATDLLQRVYEWLCTNIRPHWRYHSHFPHAFFKHDSTPRFQGLCNCDEIEYFAPTNFHVTLTHCRRARVCLCIDIENLTVIKHRIGECPNGKYRIADAS